MTNFAEQAQATRDLRSQLADLERGDEAEILFQEWSPGRKMVKLWSLSDGMEIIIPRYMVMSALTKRQQDGRYLFTAIQSEAPVFREGDVRCFLANTSPERESGLLAEAGLEHLPACPAVHLRSVYSKRQHAQNRHKQSWETLQSHLQEQRSEEERQERRLQLEATLAIAGQAMGEESASTSGPRRGRPPKS